MHKLNRRITLSCALTTRTYFIYLIFSNPSISDYIASNNKTVNSESKCGRKLSWTCVSFDQAFSWKWQDKKPASLYMVLRPWFEHRSATHLTTMFCFTRSHFCYYVTTTVHGFLKKCFWNERVWHKVRHCTVSVQNVVAVTLPGWLR